MVFPPYKKENMNIQDLKRILVTRNFSLGKLVESDTARREGLDNAPTEEAVVNLTLLTFCLPQPLRDHVKQPIRVNSGYRSPEVNRAVGGARDSQHMRGQAADITLGSIQKNRALWEDLRSSTWPFDQAILEKGGRWLHVSYCLSRNRREAKEVA